MKAFSDRIRASRGLTPRDTPAPGKVDMRRTPVTDNGGAASAFTWPHYSYAPLRASNKPGIHWVEVLTGPSSASLVIDSPSRRKRTRRSFPQTQCVSVYSPERISLRSTRRASLRSRPFLCATLSLARGVWSFLGTASTGSWIPHLLGKGTRSCCTTLFCPSIPRRLPRPPRDWVSCRTTLYLYKSSSSLYGRHCGPR